MAVRIRFLVTAAAVGLAAWFLLQHTARWIHSSPTAEGAALAAPSLPDDEKLAERELRKVKDQLDALRYSRPYIVVDTNASLLYLRSEDSIMLKTPCSTGSGGKLVDEATGRRWAFNTPSGVFRVESKLVDPWWRKPDWAFIEDSLGVPADPSQRLDPEMLGQYALGFGDGCYIHGTVYERLLGVSVTHGCIRVGSDDLERLYEKVGIGTRIYIF
ncbi:MAG: L,D-transpeptidase [Candidatus Eisenbacteria bacterium]